jgi:cardiolipin synthase
MFGFDQLPWVLLIDLGIVVPAAAHIILTKEQESAAFAWLAMIVLVPLAGVGLYLIFGINRVERRARRLRRQGARFTPANATRPTEARVAAEDQELMVATSAVQDLPLVPGNAVAPLVDGDEAFPAMLAAIAGAKQSIALSAYIFDHDKIGELFAGALANARHRGVAVRILIDDMGLRYSPSSIETLLTRRGLTTARFLPTSIRLLRYINLRNHRKVLIVDGREAFIGGINIRHGHMLRENPAHPVRDIHFRVVGPVIDQMNDLFAEDWGFATGEEIELPAWPAAEPAAGAALARLVPDGPDHHFERLQWVIQCALAAARRRVRIMTPYFLPNQVLASGLMVAALRGVDVDVVVPARTNIPFIGWAMAANFQRLLEHRVRIFLSPPPFDHSKVMVVDDRWSLVGSTNWDPRSLRLNFEANIESFDPVLATRLSAYVERRKTDSRPVDLAAVQRAPLSIRLRNNFMRMFSPYL